MKIRTIYTCEICSDYSEDKSSIETCERQGLKKLPPIGLIYGNASTRDHLYRGITFCTAKVWNDGHFVNASNWACRDTGAGDSLGDGTCSSGGYFKLGLCDIPNPNHPTFKRLVKYLKENKPEISITCWNGKKAVPLKEFTIEWRKLPMIKGNHD